MAFGPHQLNGGQAFKFDPFADEEGRTTPLIESMLDMLDLDNPPTPIERVKQVPARPSSAWPRPLERSLPGSQLVGCMYPKPEDSRLQQPRPDQSVALKIALEGFEKFAQLVANARNGGSSSGPNVSDARTVHSTLGRGSTHLLADRNENMGRVDPRKNDPFGHLSPESRRVAKLRALGNICFYPPSPPPTESLAFRRLQDLPSDVSRLPRLMKWRARPIFTRPVFTRPPPPPPPARKDIPPSNELPRDPPPPSPPPQEVNGSQIGHDEAHPDSGHASSEDSDDDELLHQPCRVWDDYDDDEDSSSFFSDSDSSEGWGCTTLVNVDVEDIEEDDYWTDSDESVYDDVGGYNGDDEGAEDIASPPTSPMPRSASPFQGMPTVRLVTSAPSVFEPLPLQNAGWIHRSPFPEAWSTNLHAEVEASINGDD